MDNNVIVTMDYSPRVSFAYQQNAIPIIRLLSISNNSQEELTDVRCKIVSTPAFSKDYEMRIASLPPGKDYSFSDLDIKLDYTFLSDVSEKARGNLELTLTNGEDESSRTIHTEEYAIEVLPYDIWPGINVIPELLATFVTPNSDVVEYIMGSASEILWKRTGENALSGYQSRDKKYVYAMINAVFDAVKLLGISYSNPAASFEDNGQRIRFPHKIYDKKLATCLDLALFFAAILEQCGLHPLILLHEGHAYAGCYLIEENLPNSIEDDLQLIRKCEGLDELVVFETTMAAGSNSGTFAEAVSAAKKHLLLDRKFHMALDIRTSRKSDITPLPIMREGLNLSNVNKGKATHSGNPIEASSKDFKETIVVGEDRNVPQNRIDNWKRHLLDMTLRNRMLNFKENKQTVPIACSRPDMLEDAIAAKRQFKLQERSALMGAGDPRSKDLMAGDALESFLQSELTGGRLRCNLTENELNKRLLTLFRIARTDIEEGGVNTLFLALGFLEWLDQGGEKRRAPLIMVPVTLGRQSVRHGFYLERYDDDAVVNVTLLEMLRRDFQLSVPGVDPPPEDESGVDVSRILQLFKQAVKEMRGWEVKEDVWLSRFSFSKFIMWKDLNDRMDELMQNPVVSHLVNHPGEGFDDGVDGVNPKDIDAQFGYETLYSPMSADSSQLAAVLSAEKGKSFVLHGPPGTGKSQTITNMIAHCLAKDKRVLFVSEKRAALEVVHKRLCSIGLEPFCLELHSNKSGKMEVLQQFKKSLDFCSSRTPAEWNEVTTKLNSIRNKLNQYESELHRVYPNGYTAYNSFAYLLGKEQDPQVEHVKPLSLSSPAAITSEEFHARKDTCDKLEVHCRQLSVNAFNDLKSVQNRQWTPQWERSFFEGVDKLKEAINTLKTKFSALTDVLNFELDTISESCLYNLIELSNVLIGAPTLKKAFTAGEWPAFSENMAKVINSGLKRDELRDKLSEFKYDDIMELGIDSMLKAYEDATGKFIVFRWLEQSKITGLLRQCRKVGTAKMPGSDTLETMIDIKNLIEADKIVNDASALGDERLGSHWNNGKPDWKEVFDIIQFGDKLHECIHNVTSKQADMGSAIRSSIGLLLESAADTLQNKGPFATSVSQLVTAWNDYREASNAVQQLSGGSDEVPLEGRNFIESIIMHCDQLAKHKGKMREWGLWLKARDQAVERDLIPILNAIEAGELKTNIAEVFEWRFREAFLDQIMESINVLRDFLGDEFDLQVDNFKKLDKRYSELSSELVVSMLASKLPGARGRSAPKGTAIGLLQRECQKKSRHLPVRKLLKGVRSILQSLKPCMLMSPLSIAQYLPSDQENFDIVIFDEASQIPVWDAIGAIARAPQCVIVGDPKQLPPTNFFSRSDGDSDDDSSSDENFVELESILDECISAGLGKSYLQWHYRSRHESLIAFSNYHYYENRLYTFPAAIETGVGTMFTFADGTYDKGKTRTNRKEAQVLVAEVVSRLSDVDEQGRSIGIVTFSQAQQALIEDLLDDARSKHPAIEQYFGNGVAEPLFVKNLENVQGDERDVIFFSVCYAKDQTGKMSMNFGPLNRDGGERRLNVAITRAREEVVVFSSIRADDIDLSRTKSIGVAHMKSYLKYAEHGVDALANITDSSITTDDYDSLFEQEVAEYIRTNGYNVHTQVGCSGYRIDLAVTHPDSPGSYVIGVECDGATYHRSATARDRDQLRQGVLEQLGWSIHRVWSTSWWHNQEYAKSKLLNAIKDAMESLIDGTPVISQQTNSAHKNIKSATKNYQELESKAEGNTIKPPVPSLEDHELSQEYPSIKYKSYARLQEMFYEPSYKSTINEQLTAIVNNEGPILSNVLHKRLCEQWGFGRAGKKIQNVLSQCAPTHLLITGQDDRKVYWPERATPGAYQTFRYPNGNEEYKRLICDIPVEELANAMFYVMTEFHSCKENVLYKEAASVFGVSRVTSKSTMFFEAALDNLRQRGVIE
jgi:very-short-patch-repair endonuclease